MTIPLRSHDDVGADPRVRPGPTRGSAPTCHFLSRHEDTKAFVICPAGPALLPDALEADVVHAGAQRSLIIGAGEPQPDGLAGPRRQIERDLGRLLPRWIARAPLVDRGEKLAFRGR